MTPKLPESNYTNNSVSVSINIPDRPGKTGVGPADGAVVQADEGMSTATR
jgi:hypothetical protein